MKNTYGISTPKTVEQFRENLKILYDTSSRWENTFMC